MFLKLKFSILILILELFKPFNKFVSIDLRKNVHHLWHSYAFGVKRIYMKSMYNVKRQKIEDVSAIIEMNNLKN